jgi:RNA polymerase sigma factor (sigma-70 family)
MTASRIRTLVPHLRQLVAQGDSRTADRELLRRFSAERDEPAFAEIVRRHGPMLLRVCRRVLHDEHGAEDICQAAFLLLAQKATSIRWHESIAGWLFQTAYRLSLNASRCARRRAHREAQATQRGHPAGRSDPVAELTVRELEAILDEELNRLPEKYRAPIVLCCLEGRSRDEAASHLGWQLGTVKDRLEQGREQLRARLARRGVLLGTALASAWLLEGGALAGVFPQATARAASLLVTGQATLAGLLPPPVAALAKGVTTIMLLQRAMILAVAGLALGLGAAAGLTTASGEVPAARAETPKKKPAEAPKAKRAEPPKEKPAPADAAGQPEALPLGGHKGVVHAVAFAKGGKTVATAGADKTVRVWNASTGVQLHKLDQPGKAVGVAFSADGRRVFAAAAGKVGTVILWDIRTGKQVWQLGWGGMQGSTGALALSPDGKVIAAGFKAGLTFAADVATGKCLFITKNPGGGTAVAFSPDGKRLAIGDATGTIQLMDYPTGRFMGRHFRGKGAVTALAYLPSGAKVAAVNGGKAVRLLDLTTNKEVMAFKAKETIRALALGAKGKRVATAGADGTVILWDSSGKEERRFSAGGAVRALAFSPDGERLVTAGDNGAIIWDLMRDEKPLPRGFKLTAKKLDALWADLASEEGGKVYRATRFLRADPARSVPFLQKHLTPKAGPGQQKLKQLIADLDSDDFDKREAATEALEKLGRAAEAALRQALAKRPSLEARRRLERLIKPLGETQALTAEQQRDVRAVRVLEQAGTAQAKKLLEALIRKSPGWWALLPGRLLPPLLLLQTLLQLLGAQGDDPAGREHQVLAANPLRIGGVRPDVLALARPREHDRLVLHQLVGLRRFLLERGQDRLQGRDLAALRRGAFDEELDILQLGLVDGPAGRLAHRLDGPPRAAPSAGWRALALLVLATGRQHQNEHEPDPQQFPHRAALIAWRGPVSGTRNPNKAPARRKVLYAHRRRAATNLPPFCRKGGQGFGSAREAASGRNPRGAAGGLARLSMWHACCSRG